MPSGVCRAGRKTSLLADLLWLQESSTIRTWSKKASKGKGGRAYRPEGKTYLDAISEVRARTGEEARRYI